MTTTKPSTSARRSLCLTVAAIYVLLALIHFYWEVFGFPEYPPVIPQPLEGPQQFPRPGASTFVGLCLLAAAFVGLSLDHVVAKSWPRWFRKTAGFGLAAVFLLRTVGEFHYFGLFRTVTDTDFGIWDTWLYTPLCLVLGLCVLGLTVTMPRRKVPDA